MFLTPYKVKYQLVNTSLEGKYHKANEEIDKGSKWQEVTMVTKPWVNLSTCHTVFMVGKLILTINNNNNYYYYCPQERVYGVKVQNTQSTCKGKKTAMAQAQ